MFLAEPNLALGMFAGGILIALLGVYDDLRGAGARKKFAIQFPAWLESCTSSVSE